MTIYVLHKSKPQRLQKIVIGLLHLVIHMNEFEFDTNVFQGSNDF